MKKITLLLLALILAACSAVGGSMQRDVVAA